MLALLAASAAPAGAATKPRKVSIGVPARGDVAVLTFDVRAARGGAPGPVLVSVKAPRSVRSRLGVVAVADKQGARKRFTVYVLNRRSRRATGAQVGGRVTVTLRGVDKEINVRNIDRAIDALSELTDEMADAICTSELETVRTLLGLRGAGSFAIAAAIKAVLCDTADDDDVEFLVDLGILVPEDEDELGCDPFPGNPFEATCAFSDTAIDAVRIHGSRGIVFSQCFAGINPCQVEAPETPNNSVLFEFQGDPSSTGPLNLRSSNQQFDGWGLLTLEQSRDGGQTFQVVERFDPP
jgi:hypothetical protein